MRTLIPRLMKKAGLAAALGMLLAVFAGPGTATAGVATAGAVLLDPFDPVPEIQFQHFGGYGCSYGCGGHYDGCDDGCGYHRHHGCGDDCGYHHARCDDGCGRHARCDQDCDHHDRCGDRCGDEACGDDCGDTARAGGDAPPPDARPPCEGRCSVTEHWQRNWHNGARVGQEWYDRGYRERETPDGHRPHNWHRADHDDDDDDGDDTATPAAAPAAPAAPAAH